MSKTGLLSELGECWRGDWSDFDGRTLRDQLDAWIELENTPKKIAAYRKTWDMCPLGEGHWTEYCDHQRVTKHKTPEGEK